MVGRTSHRGLRDWLVQRVTAVLIGAYAIFILTYLMTQSSLSFLKWHGLFHSTSMKIFTFMTLLAVIWHAWIGLWTVLTDYVKPKGLRMALELVIVLLLLGYLSWGFEILWTTH
jgi:succinate dehydrogenase / fumarate reductase, membrane anchor subunit